MKDVEKLKVLRDKGQLQKAIDYSCKFNIEKQNAEFLSVLAHIYLLRDQLDKAKEMLKTAIKKGRDCPLVIWSTTRLYLKEKKNKEALNIVTQGLQNYQNDLEGLSLLSTCLRVNNRYDSSKEICKKILNIDYRNIEANLNLGLINLSLKLFDEAQEQLEIVHEEKEHLHQIWPLLSSLYLQKENYDKAIPLYLKLYEKDKKNLKFQYSIAHCYEKLGNLKEAINFYNKITEIKKSDPELLNKVGVLHEKMGDENLAEKKFIKALNINENYLEAHINYRKILHKNGNIKESIKKSFYILQKDDRNIDAIINLFSLNTQLYKNKLIFFKNYTLVKTRYEKLQSNSKSFFIHLAIYEFIHGNYHNTKFYIEKFKEIESIKDSLFDEKEKKFNTAYYEFISKLLKNSISCKKNIKDKIYHIGESHCLSYAHKKIIIKDVEFLIQPLITFGCKAFHLANAKENQYKTIVKTNLMTIPNKSKVFISFGEIDCRHDEGFIIASSKLNKSFNQIVTKTIKDFLNFFKVNNKRKSHEFYFFNVPAPIFLVQHGKYLNDQLSKLIELYNKILSESVIDCGFKLIDVYNLTKGADGFSNREFHIDLTHLHPKTLEKIKIN